MPSIRHDVQAILSACGYTIDAQSPLHAIEAGRDTADGRETMHVWVPDVGDPTRARAEVLSSLAAAETPASRRVVLLPRTTSLGTGFLADAGRAGAKVRSYAQFYDAAFVGRRGEGDDADLGLGRSGTADDSGRFSRDLLAYDLIDSDTLEAIARKQTLTRLAAERSRREQPPNLRAPQPYHRRAGLAPAEPTTPEADLFRHLTLLLGQPPSGPQVFLIVGHAGGGKSVAFQALYTYLYEVFMKRKEAQAEGQRPIPVLPESLLAADAYSTDALFRAVAETEVAAALDPRLLDKFVRDGRAVLMIDGLDEFFADQDDFFAEIEARYLGEGSNARIVVALRDSLLSSSPSVVALVQSLAGHATAELRIFELAAWDQPEAKRALAWLKLAGRLPLPNDRDPPAVAGFLARLDASPVLNGLARLPFWCNELLDDYAAGLGPLLDAAGRVDRGLPDDEYELLERALQRLLEREWAKHRISKEGLAMPEAAFVPGFKGALLALERIIHGWQPAGGPTLPPPDRPSSREILEARYAEHGHAMLRGLLEEAAWRYRRLPPAEAAADSNSLGRDLLARLYAKRRSWAMGREDRLKGERILRHFALFRQGDSGGVDFAHDYMADYLAASHALARAAAAPASPDAALGAPVLGETEVFAGYLRRELARLPELAAKLRAALGPANPQAAAILG